MKKIFLKIPAIHCQGCTGLIETELSDLPGIKLVKADAVKKEAVVEFDSSQIDQAKILATLADINYPAEVIEDNAKEFSQKEKSASKISKKDLTWAVLGVSTFFAIYYSIGHFGGWEILGSLNSGSVSYGLILLIGFLASFHCIGMCGGLIVSYTLPDNGGGSKMSAKHWLYNLGRLISYTAMGATLGAIGSVFTFSPIINSTVMLLAGIFMLIMGASFISDNHLLKKIKIKTPEKIAKIIYANKKNQVIGPFIIGLLTAFMPCGPLQAMELYALGTGSASQGGLSLFLYALGTIPMLMGFGYFISFWSRKKLELITKVSGVVVIILGLATAGRALANFNQSLGNIEEKGQLQAPSQSGYQTVEMDVTYQGFQPNVIYIKKGLPVKWIIRDKGITGCTNEIILYNGNKVIQKKLDSKENIIEFTPNQEGEIKFSCWMKMVWGKFIVTADGQAPAGGNTSLQTDDLPTGSCACAGNSSTCNGKTSGTCGASSKNSSTGCGCGRNK